MRNGQWNAILITKFRTSMWNILGSSENSPGRNLIERIYIKHTNIFYVLFTVYPCIMCFKWSQLRCARCTLIVSIFISTSLHVSGNCVPIISRIYCIYATLVFFRYIWVAVWSAGWDEPYQEDYRIEFSSVQSNWPQFYMPFSCNISCIFMLGCFFTNFTISMIFSTFLHPCLLFYVLLNLTYEHILYHRYDPLT